MTRIVSLVLLGVLLAGCDMDHGGLQRMIHQDRAEPFGESTVFADGAAMRVPPAGTVARGTIVDEPIVTDGSLGEVYALHIPIPVTPGLLVRGRERYDIQCALCHGVLGDSRTVVAERMTLRPPPSLQKLRSLSPGRIYEDITKGYGVMPSYAAELTLNERWAVAAYVKALQLSQSTPLDDLPAAVHSEALASLGRRP